MTTPKPEAIESFIRIASRLIAIMEQEIEFLRKMEVGAIDALQEEKAALVTAYENGIRGFTTEPDALAAMEPALKTELKELTTRFDNVVTENNRALESVRNSHQRLLKAIVDAVSESRARHAGYSNTGGLPQPVGGARAARLSLSLDRRL